mgnify:CR=1 FL=1
MSAWLITGGAGYIGAHVVLALKDAGMSPVVIDDLSHGLAHRVPEDVPLVQARIQNHRALSQAIDDYSITGVIHLAALKAAGESVDMPLEYYAENVGGMVDLLSVMKEKDVRNFVYSSSAAVYGTPAANPVAEDAALIPENPYGQTKVVGEWLARDAGVAWNLSWVGTDDAHGWVRLDVGAGEDGTCSFVSKESQDLGIVWNRESAPAVLSMVDVEDMLLAEGRFPEFVGSKGLFDANGDHNDGLRRGVLVAVPDDGLTGLISELVDGEAGATTYDYVRTWEAQGWESTLSVAVDATSGRVLATSLIERPA